MANTTQQPGQVKVAVLTVTLPNGKTQEFTKFANGRVYVGTNYWTAEQFGAGLEKMRAAGATVVESTGYAWE